ncbi:MAG: hypothetical protein OEN55_10010 [Alphaproteobacteria bacterium]|nr:hypothetical protein [Alphaproteobacteria bacterium]
MEGNWDILIKAGGGAVAAVLIALAVRPARMNARSEGGLRIVEPGGGMKIVSAVMIAIAGLLALAVVAFPPDEPGEAPYAYGVLAMAVLFGGMFLYLLFVFRIAYDDNFIHVNSLFHRNRRVAWTSVTAVEYSQTWQGWRVESSEGVRFWVYPYLAGHAEFLQRVDDRIREAAHPR